MLIPYLKKNKKNRINDQDCVLCETCLKTLERKHFYKHQCFYNNKNELSATPVTEQKLDELVTCEKYRPIRTIFLEWLLKVTLNDYVMKVISNHS